MKKCRFMVSVVVMLVVSATLVQAHVKMPGFFTDNMVLQRDREVPVWGWADEGQEVTVEFAGQKKTTKADEDGKWKITLKKMEASSEPREMVITGAPDHKVSFKNVVVGDVWICSGQSNMEWAQKASLNWQEEAKTADYPMIRHIKFNKTTSVVPKDDIRGAWTVCTPQSVVNFTGVGFYFARELHKELEVPIGLIGSNWGGTRIEPWVHGPAFGKVPELKNIADRVEVRDPTTEKGIAHNRKQIENVEKWLEEANKAVEEKKMLPGAPAVHIINRVGSGDPAAIFNAMISPIVGYGIRGAIWYQGESNGGEGVEYFHKKKALITGWRELWGYEFPFYFVQLANFQNANDNPAGGDGYAKVREAQRKSLEIPKTGMAVIIDIGEARDIHPKNKQDVGKRLSRWALADEFGKKIVKSGPLFKEMEIKDGKAIISFEHVGEGLIVGEKKGLEPTKEVENGTLKRFAIAAADKKWVWADAVIDGEKVVVSSPDVQEPVAVRYAFSMNPEGCNLYNKEGLPASPFKTDDWK